MTDDITIIEHEEDPDHEIGASPYTYIVRYDGGPLDGGVGGLVIEESESSVPDALPLSESGGRYVLVSLSTIPVGADLRGKNLTRGCMYQWEEEGNDG